MKILIGKHRGTPSPHQGWADAGTAGLGFLPLLAPARSGTVPGPCSPRTAAITLRNLI